LDQFRHKGLILVDPMILGMNAIRRLHETILLYYSSSSLSSYEWLWLWICII